MDRVLEVPGQLRTGPAPVFCPGRLEVHRATPFLWFVLSCMSVTVWVGES